MSELTALRRASQGLLLFGAWCIGCEWAWMDLVVWWCAWWMEGGGDPYIVHEVGAFEWVGEVCVSVCDVATFHFAFVLDAGIDRDARHRNPDFLSASMA
jgi:hypothetical protein